MYSLGLKHFSQGIRLVRITASTRCCVAEPFLPKLTCAWWDFSLSDFETSVSLHCFPQEVSRVTLAISCGFFEDFEVNSF